MGNHYRLSYDHYVESVAIALVKADPINAWKLISQHFEATLPKWRFDLLSWLKGGLYSFHEKPDSAPINLLPVDSIISWIDIDPEVRAGLIGHCVPGTLDLEAGGKLPITLIAKYPAIDGVKSGISAAFHSGGWTGPTSIHLKSKREKLRDWLTRGFEFEVTQWIESELEYMDKDIQREEDCSEEEDTVRLGWNSNCVLSQQPPTHPNHQPLRHPGRCHIKHPCGLLLIFRLWRACAPRRAGHQGELQAFADLHVIIHHPSPPTTPRAAPAAHALASKAACSFCSSSALGGSSVQYSATVMPSLCICSSCHLFAARLRRTG